MNLPVQFCWYLVVGGLSFLADLYAFMALLMTGIPTLLASALGFMIGAVVNYWLSALLAFRAGRFGRTMEVSRLLAVALVGLGLTTALMHIFISFLHLSPVLAKVIAVPIVLVWNFLGRRWFVFHKRMPNRTAALSAGIIDGLRRGPMKSRERRGNRRSEEPSNTAYCNAAYQHTEGHLMSAKEHLEQSFIREQYREEYWRRRDPIIDDRMLWRANSFRHMMHLLPGQTILEIGGGSGRFTRRLVEVSRGECPITVVTFAPTAMRPSDLPETVTFLPLTALPGPLAGRQFDFIVAHDMLDRRSGAWLLQNVYDLLAPGGQVLLYESNPWNVLLKVRHLAARLVGRDEPRLLLSRPDLYELLSEVGFNRIFAVYNDFVYAPLTRHMAWALRNLSIVLENMPGIRTLAGSILVHAQKPPRPAEIPSVSLCEHDAMRQAVSIVVPCHNEEMNIGPLVANLRRLFGDYIHEIVLVDDNSQDGTRRVIQALAADDPRIKPVYRVPPNGVGRAIADGIHAATGRYILTMDCDFQHLLPEIRDLFDAAAQGYDVVVGSRFSRHSVLLNYPFPKIIANRAFHTLAQILLLGRFRDLTNNLKLMRRDIAQQINLLEPGFAVNAETGLLPLMMGYRVQEVPISWIGRGIDMGASSFRVLRVGGGYWRVLQRLCLLRMFGKGPYRQRAGAAGADGGLTVPKHRFQYLSTSRFSG
jgi:dolichol-phosphate mannosyltransferase